MIYSIRQKPQLSQTFLPKTETLWSTCRLLRDTPSEIPRSMLSGQEALSVYPEMHLRS